MTCERCACARCEAERIAQREAAERERKREAEFVAWMEARGSVLDALPDRERIRKIEVLLNLRDRDERDPETWSER